ncbi:hypothetical protein KAX97_05220 [candidate division WOR-3 bacterium]|nr:hypothetical protein [candidate division WOR-3 bacterium]
MIPTTRTIPVGKLCYEKMITLKQHVVDIKEMRDGDIMVCITPTSDPAANSSFIMHKANDNIIRVSTTRNLQTDAKDVAKLDVV